MSKKSKKSAQRARTTFPIPVQRQRIASDSRYHSPEFYAKEAAKVAKLAEQIRRSTQRHA